MSLSNSKVILKSETVKSVKSLSQTVSKVAGVDGSSESTAENAAGLSAW